MGLGREKKRTTSRGTRHIAREAPRSLLERKRKKTSLASKLGWDARPEASGGWMVAISTYCCTSASFYRDIYCSRRLHLSFSQVSRFLSYGTRVDSAIGEGRWRPPSKMACWSYLLISSTYLLCGVRCMLFASLH